MKYFHFSLLWSEWSGGLSEKTMYGPMLPRGPIRILLPRLWVLSIPDGSAPPWSLLHPFLWSVSALHMCQRQRHLRTTHLSTNSLCSTHYQARTVLPWVHRYFIQACHCFLNLYRLSTHTVDNCCYSSNSMEIVIERQQKQKNVIKLAKFQFHSIGWKISVFPVKPPGNANVSPSPIVCWEDGKSFDELTNEEENQFFYGVYGS